MLNTLLFSLLLLTQTQVVNAQEKLPELTILHFGSGFNDLDKYIVEDVNQMEKFGSTSKVKILAQLASQSAGTAKRYLVKKDSNPGAVTSPVIQDIGKVDMGSWKVFADFVIWGIKNYPAKKYFVIIGGHGSGWKGPRSRGGGQLVRAISPDYNTGNSITALQLADAFDVVRKSTGKQVDVFGADACLMATIEVATELGGKVDTMVASAEVEPGEGWVYDELLKRLNRESNLSSINIARISAHAYMEGYRRLSSSAIQKESLTISATNLSEVRKFNDSIARLNRAIHTAKMQSEMLNILYDSRRYSESHYADLGDFLKTVVKLSHDSSIQSAAREALRGYERIIIRTQASDSHSFATGLSIWAPREGGADSYFDFYRKLVFHKQTQWGRLFSL